MKDFNLSIGFYPGMLLGLRTYKNTPEVVHHVLYLPFVDICLTIYKDERE